MPRRLVFALALAGSLCGSPGDTAPGDAAAVEASATGASPASPSLAELLREAEENRFLYSAEETVAIYRRAVALDPESALAHQRLGVELTVLGNDLDRPAAERQEEEKFAPHPPSGRCRALDHDRRRSCGPECVEASVALCTAFLLDPSVFCDPSCSEFCDQDCYHWRVWYLPEAVIRAALARHPGSVCARHHLARLLEDQQRIEEAAVIYSEVIERSPGLGCAKRDLMRLRLRQRRVADAERSFDRLREAEIEPRDLLFLEEIGSRHAAEGRLDRALSAYRKLVDRRRRAIERAGAERTRLLATGEEPAALDSLDDEIDHRTELASTLATIGDLLREQGRREPARAAYLESIALGSEPPAGLAEIEAHLASGAKTLRRFDPRDDRPKRMLQRLGWTYVALADLHRELGEDEAALGFLRRALEVALDPDYRTRGGTYPRSPVAVLRDIGWSLLRLDRPAEAAGVFRRGLALEPDDAHLHHDLATALFDLERLGEAEEALHRALAIDPGFVAAHLKLAWVHHRQGREAAADAACLRAIAAAPEDPRPYRVRGWLLAEGGRLDEAVGAYRRAIDLAPEHAPTRASLAWVLLRAGRVREALAEYALAGEAQLRVAGRRVLDELWPGDAEAGGER